MDELASVIAHPRSLARPSAQWRPPTVQFPRTSTLPAVSATISKYRTGRSVVAFMHRAGYDDIPAYLVSLRLTDPSGTPLSLADSQQWVDSIAFATFDAPPGSVYHVVGEPTPTFCWLVNGSYAPISSPIEVFTALDKAA